MANIATINIRKYSNGKSLSWTGDLSRVSAWQGTWLMDGQPVASFKRCRVAGDAAVVAAVTHEGGSYGIRASDIKAVSDAEERAFKAAHATEIAAAKDNAKKAAEYDAAHNESHLGGEGYNPYRD